MVSYLEAIILGIVQGLTEFLPISSTAHLRIVPQIFGWGDPGAAFTAVVQLGTMAAVNHVLPLPHHTHMTVIAENHFYWRTMLNRSR